MRWRSLHHWVVTHGVNMKFVILGAGNIGTLIGAKLAQLDDSGGTHSWQR